MDTPSVEERYRCEDDDGYDVSEEVPDARRRPLYEQQSVASFLFFCAVFSIVPGCAVSCLSVSSAVLGFAGTKQSALLFGSYTASALLVATPATQMMGPKSAMIFGMALACGYVVSFVVASALLDREAGSDHQQQGIVSGILSMGAVLGGIGAGILWTAAGVYLARAASETDMSDPRFEDNHHDRVPEDTAELSSPPDPPPPAAPPSGRSNRMAGWFAFFVLVEETLLEGMSAVLVRRFQWRWTAVFGLYASLAVLATCLMQWVHDYHPGPAGGLGGGETDELREGRLPQAPTRWERWRCDKLTLALRLLLTDPKAKYLSGLPLAFGFACGFFISFVSGQVVPVSLSGLDLTPTSIDDDSISTANATAVVGSVNAAMAESLAIGGDIGASEAWVGALVAIHGLVAAIASLLLGHCVSMDRELRRVLEASDMYPTDSMASSGQDRDPREVRGRRSVSLGSIGVLIGGCVILAGIGSTFLVWPRADQWRLASLVGLYAMYGVARAAFEGTVKAVHASLYGSQRSATEGAFALVVLFNGVGAVTSYVVSLQWHCQPQDPGCVLYRDGSRHNVRGFALSVVMISLATAVGYVRAWFLIQQESGRKLTFDVAADSDGGNESPMAPFWRAVRSYQTVRSADDDDNANDRLGTELREVT